MGLLNSNTLNDYVTQTIPNNARNIWDAILRSPDDLKKLFGNPNGAQDVMAAVEKQKQIPVNPQTFIDQGMNLAGMAPVGGLLGQTVYHGSPHKFDKFDMSKIGTGEGAQAYGHGLYFAESPEVALKYQKDITASKVAGAQKYLQRSGGNIDDAIATVKAEIKGLYGLPNAGGNAAKRDSFVKLAEEKLSELNALKNSGNHSTGAFYKVDIPDEAIPRMLDWDAPLSKQPESIKGLLGKYSKGNVDVEPIANDLRLTAENDSNLAKNSRMVNRFIDKYTKNPDDQTVRRQLNYYFKDYPYETDLYKTPLDALESQWAIPTGDAFKKAQSEFGAGNLEQKLKEMGLPGIRYLDGSSRNAGQGTSNFVLFDDQLPRILEVNGKPTGLLSYADEAKKARITSTDPYKNMTFDEYFNAVLPQAKQASPGQPESWYKHIIKWNYDNMKKRNAKK